MFRDHSLLVFVDDKHHLKIGEPGLPVAAVDQGRRVVVGLNSMFQVADHDFTRFSLVPSVTVICDVPGKLLQVCGLQTHVFAPLSLSISLSLSFCLCVCV